MPSAGAKPGLEDVVAGESEICFIDGQEGRLVYRGYDIDDLVAHSSFEEVCFLLWNGHLPTASEFSAMVHELRHERTVPDFVLDAIVQAPRDAHPMSILRTCVSMLGMLDDEKEGFDEAANIRRAVRLASRMATLVAAIGRIRQGKDPVAPDPDLNHAENFLYMLWDRKPDELSVRTLRTALILHADHELNASTFAARVTAATLSDLYSAITSAVGALKGPLHGGANERVMRMLIEIGSVEGVAPYLHEALAQHKKIMGFGHRVYRTEDPRATHLRRLSRELGEKAGEIRWYEMSREIERIMLEEKQLHPNVDFFSASTYYTMGLPIDLYTPIFAVSRIAGWTAHVLEQYRHNRLIRPRSEYVGPKHLSYIALDQR